MVQHNSDSQHRSQLSISSPSKDQVNKNRHVSSSIACRKALIIIAFLAAIIVILLQKPPNISSEGSYTSDHRDSRTVTVETNMDEHHDSRSTSIERNPIQLIAILGERNSGTRWTFE